jgi:hypothetical protein
VYVIDASARSPFEPYWFLGQLERKPNRVKWHLLNWTLGPAILSGLLSAAGAGEPANMPQELWRDFPGLVVGVASFFGAWFIVMFVLRLIAQRLNEGRLTWTETRLGAFAMAVQWLLLAGAFAVLLAVRQTAIAITGGWSPGWQPGVLGAMMGAAVGFVLGLGVAQLRLPERLGLDKAKTANAGS